MIGLTIDDHQVMAKLGALQQTIDKSVPRNVFSIGLEILRLSQFEVPHDEGTLQNSGTVEEIDGDVIIGYHTLYAARLHENPQYRFQKGRKGKYLEDPIRENEEALGIKFGDLMKDDIKGVL